MFIIKSILRFPAQGVFNGEDGILNSRIIISMPIHPALFAFYGFLLFPLFIFSPAIFASLSSYLGISSTMAAVVGMLVPALSFPLSLVNIVIKRIETSEAFYALESKYISFMGIPIPVFVPVIQKREIVIALNLGGAVLPVALSSLLLISMFLSSKMVFLKAIADIVVTSIVTYLTSKAMPGVGIVTPSFLPPITSSIAGAILGGGNYIFPIAYLGGVLGSLIGADILRLAKDFEKFKTQFGSVFLSIGGAGTFDGIFLSGIFAAIFAAIL
jgi:uncharacterized membrane protein